LLLTKDYVVDTANGCGEAIKLMKDNKYDLFLMDLVMDEKDGVETFKEIRKIDPKANAVLFTAFGIQEDGEAGLLSKAIIADIHDEYLRKPIDAEELFNAVEKHINN